MPSTGAELQQLNGHTNDINSVAFSHDSTRHCLWLNAAVLTSLCECGMPQQVPEVQLQQLNGHTDWVRSVAFSHDGTRIVSGSMTNLCECGMPQQVQSCSS
jgi:WD40 repeat protein